MECSLLVRGRVGWIVGWKGSGLVLILESKEHDLTIWLISDSEEEQDSMLLLWVPGQEVWWGQKILCHAGEMQWVTVVQLGTSKWRKMDDLTIWGIAHKIAGFYAGHLLLSNERKRLILAANCWCKEKDFGFTEHWCEPFVVWLSALVILHLGG